MLLVDYRAGSKELIKPLAKILGSDKVEEASLDFGDVAFTGRGAKNVLLDIGIEFKTLADIVQCCRDGRFAGHQLPGMRKTYDHSWLMIEGTWRHDETSGLITGYQGSFRGWRAIPGKMRASEFEKHLLTFELCGGVHVRYTNLRADSLRAIVELYRWWTDRTFDSHTSHLAIHQPVTLGVVSDFRKAVMAWPSIGLKVSKAVETYFTNQQTGKGSIVAASLADVDQWAEIETDGRRFGRASAQKLVKFLRGVK
jgi:ERCC4-type nuclease